MTTITQERSKLAAVDPVPLRRREQWGARFDYTNSRPVDEPADYQFVHISVTNPRNYASNDAHARAIEAIGISRFPATGISYGRGFMSDSAAYEFQPIGRRGAHTVNDKKLAKCTMSGCPSRGGSLSAPSYNLNVNARAYVVCMNVGDTVSAKLIDRMARKMAADRLAGFVKLNAAIHGHRCVAWKDCPGARMWAFMAELARLVAHYVRVGLGATPTPTEDFMGFIDNQDEFNNAMARALEVVLEPKDLTRNPPQPVHRALTWFRVAPWHQILGKGPQNMHGVMGELRAAVTGSLPALIREAGDEIGLTPEQTEQLAASVAAKVERVTVVVEDGE